MLPKITELEFDKVQTPQEKPVIKPSYQYDFEKGDFVLKDGKLKKVEGKDSLKVWITKVLKTERYKFKIYEGIEYGTTIEDLIGTNRPIPFVEAELKREVTNSLRQHPVIENVVNWKFDRIKARMNITFTVVTIEGVFEMEVDL